MKFAAIVLLAAFAVAVNGTTTTPPPVKCPDPDGTLCPKNPPTDPEDSGLVAHPTECAKFCQCLYKPPRAIEQLCGIYDEASGDRLHFSDEEKVCTWPWDANCDPNATPPPY